MDQPIICSFIIVLCMISIVSSRTFTVDLIHRDSIFSPFHNSSATPEELVTRSVLRSYSRLNHFQQSYAANTDEEKMESVLIPNEGDYLMKISIGSPPIENYAVADTGSDLVWFHCAPCDQCYAQDAPLFNPLASSTYLELPCGATACQFLSKHTCGTSQNECHYDYSYGDKSYTKGTLAVETFSFDSTIGTTASFANSIFGCGHQNNGVFNSRGSGVVGLGGGPLSLVSQLGDQIQHTFSYCLPPVTSSINSKLRFGKDVAFQTAVVLTWLISRDSHKTFYYVNLEGATVGGKTIMNEESSTTEGNIIIDSGTTLTFLQTRFYYDLEAAVKESIVGKIPVQDPPSPFRLCYNELPDLQIVFHFSGGLVLL